MNNDLISRSALKKAISEFHQKENDRLHNPLWGSIDLNALNRLIDNAPTVEERPQGECKKCKAYRQYGSRADGYCNIARMTPEGETFINVNEDFFCSYFREV